MPASKSYCRAYAEDVADRRAGAQQVLVALLAVPLQAASGRVIGGKHAVRTGVIAGGVTGGVLGGAHANKKWDKVYWRAYDNCRPGKI